MATTFEPNNVTASCVLSSGNLVATFSSSGLAVANRPITGLSYFEATITTLTGTPSIGVVGTRHSIASAQGLGTSFPLTFTSVGYANSGAVTVNGVTLSTIAAYVQGDRIDVAVDPILHLIWFRKNGGNWNNSGAADPATAVGGIDISGIFPGTLWAAVYASANLSVWTAKFSTAFTGTPPSGFQSIDVIGIGVAKNSTGETKIPPNVAPTIGPAARAQSHSADSISRWFTPPATAKFVSGILKELGVAVAGRRVAAFHRVTHEWLGEAVTAGDGSWSINCMNRSPVYVVALDSPYNALIFDNVIPG